MTRAGNIQTGPAALSAHLMAVLAMTVAGCGGPNQANIEVRKQKQDLEDRIAQLEREREADRATIRGLESRIGTRPTLPQERLAQLVTVHGIEIGRLTGGDDRDPSRPGDEGLRVYVTPIDDEGQKLKAAGSFIIEAFDLALEKEQRIGHWEFDTAAARRHWLGVALMYGYVLPCPWQQVPAHSELTIKITFRDELTGRVFNAQTVVSVRLPPPATRPAT